MKIVLVLLFGVLLLGCQTTEYIDSLTKTEVFKHFSSQQLNEFNSRYTQDLLALTQDPTKGIPLSRWYSKKPTGISWLRFCFYPEVEQHERFYQDNANDLFYIWPTYTEIPMENRVPYWGIKIFAEGLDDAIAKSLRLKWLSQGQYQDGIKIVSIHHNIRSSVRGCYEKDDVVKLRSVNNEWQVYVERATK